MTEHERDTSQATLLDRLRKTLPGSKGMSPAAVFHDWLHGALAKYLESPDDAAFDPCRSSFANQRDFRTNFTRFVAAELDGDTSIGKAVALNEARRVIVAILSEATRSYDSLSIHVFDEDPKMVRHLVFEFFSVLTDISIDASLRWATHAIAEGSRWADKLGPGGTPAALQVDRLIADRGAGADARADYLCALLSWCISKRAVFPTTPAARRLLPLALASMRDKAAVNRQLGTLEALLDRTGSQAMINRIEEEIDIEDLVIGLEGEETRFLSDCDSLVHALAPGLAETVRSFDDPRKRDWQTSMLLGQVLQQELNTKAGSTGSKTFPKLWGQGMQPMFPSIVVDLSFERGFANV